MTKQRVGFADSFQLGKIIGQIKRARRLSPYYLVCTDSSPLIKRRNTLINDEESISQFRNMARSIEQVNQQIQRDFWSARKKKRKKKVIYFLNIRPDWLINFETSEQTFQGYNDHEQRNLSKCGKTNLSILYLVKVRNLTPKVL